MSGKKFNFNELETADLVVDATYSGGTYGNFRDDPLSKLLSSGNQGGFRIVGNSKTSKYKMIGNAVPPEMSRILARAIKEDYDG